jgi:hypothetical protein
LLGENSKNFCFAKKGDIYVVYLPDGGSADLNLPDGKFTVERFNPRTGGDLEKISAESSAGKLRLTAPENESTEDWAFLVRKPK